MAVRFWRVSSKAHWARMTTRPRPWAYISRMAATRSCWPARALRRSGWREDPPPGAGGAHLGEGAPALLLGGEGVAPLFRAEDRAAGREVRAADVLAQLVGGERGIVDERDGGVHDLAEVVGRDGRGHAHGDAGRAVGGGG